MTSRDSLRDLVNCIFRIKLFAGSVSLCSLRYSLHAQQWVEPIELLSYGPIKWPQISLYSVYHLPIFRRNCRLLLLIGHLWLVNKGSVLKGLRYPRSQYYFQISQPFALHLYSIRLLFFATCLFTTSNLRSIIYLVLFIYLFIWFLYSIYYKVFDSSLYRLSTHIYFDKLTHRRQNLII